MWNESAVAGLPHWIRPPAEGLTVDDLFRLPLPAHTELIDGAFVFRAAQSLFHTDTNGLLTRGLGRTVPKHLAVRREMTIVLDRRQGPEPDVCVIRRAACGGPAQNHYHAEDVVLAAETVSRDTEIRDRERLPQLYAQAGIPHFWRVEMGAGGRPEVHVHELDRTSGAYRPTGVHRYRLRLSVPFTIDIDLAEIDDL